MFGEDALPGLINAGIDCIEHGTGLTDDTIELMVEHGTALVPTLINIENFPGIADAAAKYPVYARHMRDLYASCQPRVGAAREAGVPIYAGTDAGSMVAHGRIADEVDALKGIGMSADRGAGCGVLGCARVAWADRDWSTARRPTWCATPTTRAGRRRAQPSRPGDPARPRVPAEVQRLYVDFSAVQPRARAAG